MGSIDPQVQIRIIDIAMEMAKGTLPTTHRGEAGLTKYTEYFNKAYNAIAKTVQVSPTKP